MKPNLTPQGLTHSFQLVSRLSLACALSDTPLLSRKTSANQPRRNTNCRALTRGITMSDSYPAIRSQRRAECHEPNCQLPCGSQLCQAPFDAGYLVHCTRCACLSRTNTAKFLPRWRCYSGSVNARPHNHFQSLDPSHTAKSPSLHDQAPVQSKRRVSTAHARTNRFFTTPRPDYRCQGAGGDSGSILSAHPAVP
jgi:hypothetical protein